MELIHSLGRLQTPLLVQAADVTSHKLTLNGAETLLAQIQGVTRFGFVQQTSLEMTRTFV
jgi:hypothetical protein